MTGNLNSKEIPSPEMLSKAAKVGLWSEEGKKVSFGSIFEEHRTVVVFIRTYLLSVVLREYTYGVGCCRSFLLRGKSLGQRWSPLYMH